MSEWHCCPACNGTGWRRRADLKPVEEDVPRHSAATWVPTDGERKRLRELKRYLSRGWVHEAIVSIDGFLAGARMYSEDPKCPKVCPITDHDCPHGVDKEEEE